METKKGYLGGLFWGPKYSIIWSLLSCTLVFSGLWVGKSISWWLTIPFFIATFLLYTFAAYMDHKRG